MATEATVGVRAPYIAHVVQMGLAVAVAHLYAIETTTFRQVLALAALGFAVQLLLPQRARMGFFVALSLVGAVVALGPADAGWLLAIGGTLIGLCHLPASPLVRVGLLVATAGVLAAARAGAVGAPWSAALWPVLGSMFMFRLAIYLHTLSTSTPRTPTGGLAARLAYFFMLPGVAFPLFPIIDYQTFLRTYFDRDAREIYDQGMSWITRGLVHLLLYRLVYQGMLLDPVDVTRLSDVVQLVLGTFLLYLRVSGQFHLIVGILHLFGFRLPETHKLYYLATSFTDLWRRINIYWTEFMTKLVFYPTYFRVKGRGAVSALVISTVAVFVITWLLHAYQWFWLRGGFPITVPDTLFWAVLGALVTVGAVGELRTPKRPGQRQDGWNASRAWASAKTFVSFALLWWLWSSESVAQMAWTLGAAANVDVKGVAMLVLTVGVVAALGGRDWQRRGAPGPGWLQWLRESSVQTSVTLVALALAGLPVVEQIVPAGAVTVLAQMKATGLNTSDTARQHRGYYEQLDVRASANTDMAGTVSDRGRWQEITELGVLHPRTDILIMDLLPSKSVQWNGRTFSTNRWGMRDRDYELDKAPGTFRIALLGASHVMGDNVGDDESFENLVEDRLNREFRRAGVERFEILNFAMPSYSSLQQLAMLEDRVFGFSPDMVIMTVHVSDRELTERALERIAEHGYAVPFEPVSRLIADAGLSDVGDGGLAVPFTQARSALGRLGIDTRMPFSESASRIRQISDSTIDAVLRGFASTATAHGARPAVLALNVVVEHLPVTIPHADTIRALGLPVLDLFHLYPADRIAALRVAPWDDHPNSRAHRLAADRLYPLLTALLESSNPDGDRRLIGDQ